MKHKEVKFDLLGVDRKHVSTFSTWVKSGGFYCTFL